MNCKNRETGESLKDAIAKLGGDFEHLDEARIEKGTIAAFLEPHNELGRHLEAEDLSELYHRHLPGRDHSSWRSKSRRDNNDAGPEGCIACAQRDCA